MNSDPSKSTTKISPDKLSHDAKDENIYKLEKALEKEKDLRDQDRFLAFLVLIIAINVWIFSRIENWAGAVVIGILQLIGLVILANRFGIQEIWTVIQQLLEWNKSGKSKGKNPK